MIIAVAASVPFMILCWEASEFGNGEYYQFIIHHCPAPPLLSSESFVSAHRMIFPQTIRSDFDVSGYCFGHFLLLVPNKMRKSIRFSKNHAHFQKYD